MYSQSLICVSWALLLDREPVLLGWRDYVRLRSGSAFGFFGVGGGSELGLWLCLGCPRAWEYPILGDSGPKYH